MFTFIPREPKRGSIVEEEDDHVQLTTRDSKH